MFSFSNFWEFDALPPPMNQKPGKANFRELVSKKIPGDACPRAPLEACSLGPLFRKSVSIYARSVPGMIWQMTARYSQTAKTLFSHLNRGDNNKRTLTGIAKWWLPPLDRGFIYNINHFSNYLRTSVNDSLICR